MSRNKHQLYGRRKELKQLIGQAYGQGLTALVHGYKKELEVVEKDLKAIAMYGGAEKMMRTPWKRIMHGNGRYFEQL